MKLKAIATARRPADIPPDSAEEQAPSANPVNDHCINPGDNKVPTGNDKADRDRIGESQHAEQRSGVIHEDVKAGKLRECHKTTSRDESPEVGANCV